MTKAHPATRAAAGQAGLPSPSASPGAARSSVQAEPLEGPRRTVLCRWKGQVSTGTVPSEALSRAAG